MFPQISGDVLQIYCGNIFWMRASIWVSSMNSPRSPVQALLRPPPERECRPRGAASGFLAQVARHPGPAGLQAQPV